MIMLKNDGDGGGGSVDGNNKNNDNTKIWWDKDEYNDNHNVDDGDGSQYINF